MSGPIRSRIQPYGGDQLERVFSNHVQIAYLPEEIYLDFCVIEAESVPDVEVSPNEVVNVKARIKSRVILTREHANRLVQVLQQGLASRPPVDE